MKKLINIIGDVFWKLHPLIGAGVMLSFVPIISYVFVFIVVKLTFEYVLLGILASYLLFCWVNFILALLKRLNEKD